MNYREEVMRNCPGFATDTMEKKLSLGGLGVAGEGGEVADLIKKVLHHEVPLETVREKMIKEMGDVHWYLEYLAAAIGVTTEDVLQANVAKLRARHPNGWTPASQQAKLDERAYNCPANGKTVFRNKCRCGKFYAIHADGTEDPCNHCGTCPPRPQGDEAR